ncbi:MAG: polysaccharide biosynthesis/export family protein [Muribaculum sp.]|nr:polysaccharide biosynthesis/export family protein [Muribaculum sp.]
MKLYRSLLLCIVATSVCCVSSCTSAKKDISYVQDLTSGTVIDITQSNTIKARPDDKLSIIINSKDPQLADLFNLPIVTHRVGDTNNRIGGTQQILSYVVDSEGNIDFPVLGRIHVAGLNRQEIAKKIKTELIDRKLVSDPVVTVDFDNLFVSVIGEVNKPGRIDIDRERVSILDALGEAGDLTIYGDRRNVYVLRENEGKVTAYKVDLTDATGLIQSPVYYLQQTDVVYVDPNNTRARQSTVNGNNVLSTSFWISLASLLTTVCVLVFK